VCVASRADVEILEEREYRCFATALLTLAECAKVLKSPSKNARVELRHVRRSSDAHDTAAKMLFDVGTLSAIASFEVDSAHFAIPSTGRHVAVAALVFENESHVQTMSAM
jgi:hypothetical protein